MKHHTISFADFVPMTSRVVLAASTWDNKRLESVLSFNPDGTTKFIFMLTRYAPGPESRQEFDNFSAAMDAYNAI